MFVRSAIALGLFLSASPILAQNPAQNIVTSAGPVTIVDADDAGLPIQQLLIGGVPVLIGDPAMQVWVEEQRDDFLLVGKSGGGNACPAMFVWINVAADIPATPEFGTCAEDVQLVDDGTTFVVTMSGFSPGSTPRAYIYDGAALTEMVMPQTNSASPPAEGPLQWVGKYPYDLIVGADWRDDLVTLIGEEEYMVAPRLFALGSPMAEDGDWVVGTGCDHPACDIARGAIALHKTDGRILVALTDENGPRLYGRAMVDLPAALTQVMGQ